MLNIPPMRSMTNEDVKFLNNIAIGREELHSRTRLNKGKRRQASKTLSDIRFLMSYVEKKVDDANKRASIITLESFDDMYDVVVKEEPFAGGERDSQKKWNTIVNSLRKKLKMPTDVA